MHMKPQNLVFCECGESVILCALLCNSYQNFYFQLVKVRYFLFNLVFCGCRSVLNIWWLISNVLDSWEISWQLTWRFLDFIFNLWRKFFINFFFFSFVYIYIAPTNRSLISKYLLDLTYHFFKMACNWL